jgi:hypothetical protein
MASRRVSPEDLRQIRELAAGWGKIVARRAFGEQGPGLDTDFSALEEVAQEAARGLTEGALAALLERQAQDLSPEHPCPGCGRPCPVNSETRPLNLKGGQQVQLHEPACHCPACRRDFFPPPLRATP